MTDSLYLMPRYWGSDDSDVENGNTTVNLLRKRLKQGEKGKKIKINCDDDANDKVLSPDVTLNGDLNGYSPQKEKKKKKRKRDPEASIDHTEDNEVVEISNQDNIHAEVIQNNEEEPDPQKPKKKRRKKHTQVDSSESNLQTSGDGNNLNLDCPLSMEVNGNGEGTEIQTSDVNPDECSESTELYPVIKDVLNKEKQAVRRSLPDWLANPTVVNIDVKDTEKSISDLQFLDDKTKEVLSKCGIRHLFPVQMEVIPFVLQTYLKRSFVRPPDLCVSSPTGSGKTLAYVIPIVQSLKTRIIPEIRALVVLPVGELAVQVFKVFNSFCKGTTLRAALLTGQKSFIQEQDSLIKHTTYSSYCQIDIIVTTPGRLLDHIDRTPEFTLEHLRFLVIDEADRMMEEIQQGWLKKVEHAKIERVSEDIASKDCPCLSVNNVYVKKFDMLLPCPYFHYLEPCQKLFFSATLSHDPEKLHELSLYHPKLFTSIVEKSSRVKNIKAKKAESQEDAYIGRYTTPKELSEQLVICKTAIKPLVISHLIAEKKYRRVLCFTQSLEHSHRLHLVLTEMLKDFNIRELSSNLRAVQRKIILEQFTAGKVNVLVCSDIMSRGMDIDNVDCVISYDAPHFMKTYIHRIGRTARAGKIGVAITLLEKNELPNFKTMLTSVGKSLPLKLNIDEKDLVPLEETFKKALTSASSIISAEKRTESVLKRGVRQKTRSTFETGKKPQYRNKRQKN